MFALNSYVIGVWPQTNQRSTVNWEAMIKVATTPRMTIPHGAGRRDRAETMLPNAKPSDVSTPSDF